MNRSFFDKTVHNSQAPRSRDTSPRNARHPTTLFSGVTSASFIGSATTSASVGDTSFAYEKDTSDRKRTASEDVEIESVSEDSDDTIVLKDKYKLNRKLAKHNPVQSAAQIRKELAQTAELKQRVARPSGRLDKQEQEEIKKQLRQPMDKISSDSDNNSPDSDSFIWCSGGYDSPIDGMKDHQKLKAGTG